MRGAEMSEMYIRRHAKRRFPPKASAPHARRNTLHNAMSYALRYARSARSRARRAVSSQPRHGSVMDLPYTPPSTGWLPSSR